MIRFTRRGFLFTTTALVPAGIMAGCAVTPSTTPGAPATVSLNPMLVADIQGLVASVNAMFLQFVALDPKAISAATLADITAAQTAANAALVSLAGTALTPASGTALQVIDIYLNDALQVIGTVLTAVAPLDPKLAPLVPIYDVSVVLVKQVLEPQINMLIGQVIATSAALKTVSATPPSVAAAKAAIAAP